MINRARGISAAKAFAALALAAALGTALVLVISGGGASGHRAPRPAGLEPNVALRVSATGPAAADPALFRRFAATSGSAALAHTVTTVERGLARQKIDLDHLLARVSSLSLSLERSCPPPAMLECRPQIRVCAHFSTAPPPSFPQQLRAGVMAGLQADGLRRLRLRRESVTSAEETLARWRLSGDVLELTTGWLELGHCQPPPERAEAGVRVERDAEELRLLFKDERQ